MTPARAPAPGMALALLSVVWSALRAGSNTALFRLGLGDADAGADGGDAARPLVDDEEGRAFVQARTSLRLSALIVCTAARGVLRSKRSRAAPAGTRGCRLHRRPSPRSGHRCFQKGRSCSARRAVKAGGRATNAAGPRRRRARPRVWTAARA